MNVPPVVPSEVCVDDRLEVRDSRIEGRGLFFRSPVAAGTVVLRLGGRLVSTDELVSFMADAVKLGWFVDTISVYDDAHLVLPPNSAVHFGNHSCDPTLWHVGPYEIATRIDVEPGQEATIDYGTQSAAEDFRMTCRCGTSGCRGEITSDDWQLPKLQARYQDHWVPVLQRRIDAGRGQEQ